MRLFAIGDLHLPGGEDKPMNIFGSQWDRHFFRIQDAWAETVREDDCVLIPGDISWAMHLEEAMQDLQAIGKLPGRKILIRGNHDYWWNSISRIREALPEGMNALQQDAVDLGPCVVCGTRGWAIPTPDQPLSQEDEKIYRRETVRLQMALDQAEEMAKGRPVIAMLHYPPLYAYQKSSDYTRLLEAYGVCLCVYGHLHGAGIQAGFSGMEKGVRYALTSCDSLDFKLLQLPEEWWVG